MNYDYNGNLLENERIDLVAKEIINKYSQIPIEKAQEAAMLEGRISKDKTIYDELNRLYNIMLVNNANKSIVSIVYKDYLDILNHNYLEEDTYINLAKGIEDYLNAYAEFPNISDY